MAEKQFDVTVIGGGPGGYVAAIRASQLGMKVGLVERDRLGGICLNWGCVPSKALIRSAEIFHTLKKSHEFGILHNGLSYDYSKIIARSRAIADRVSKGVDYLMRKNNVEVAYGTARMKGLSSIEITKNGEVADIIRSKNIIIATGGRARSIPGILIDRKKIITSTEALSKQEQPKSIIIIGGGAIGIEFAYFYNSFGTKVTVVEMMPTILPNEDKELTKILESSLTKSGIDILTNSKVISINGEKEAVVTVSTISGNKELKAEIVLMAVGVQANIENLGLDVIGVKSERGFICVDQFGKTNVDGIYAVGDISGPPLLAHVASQEGIIAANHMAGKADLGMDRSNFPSCTYCQPQVASVGMTEEAAAAKGIKIRVGRFPFRPLGKSLAIGEIEGMVKLIFDEKNGELLGAHILGSEATELIAELVLAKSLKATWENLHNTMHAHPTLSEAVMEAAGQAFGVAINI